MMRSLRSRLIVGMLGGMAVLLTAAGAFIYAVQRHHLYQAFDGTLLSSANSLALLFHPGPGGIEFDASRVASLPAGELREGAFFQFWSSRPVHLPPDFSKLNANAISTRPAVEMDDWGEPPPDGASAEHDGFFDGPPDLDGFDLPPRHHRGRRGRVPGYDANVIRSPSLGDTDLPRFEAALGEPRFATIALPDGSSGRAVGVRFRVPEPGGPQPRRLPIELTAVVAASTKDIDSQLHFFVLLLIATAFGTMTVSAVMAWLVVSRGLRPLGVVASTMAAIDASALKQRFMRDGVPLEIEPVVSQLNGLLARLDEAFDRERSLTADVAHELRTPVAEIRTITEIALTRLRNPEEYQQALRDSLETASHLQGLIEKLLVLARMEAGQIKLDFDLIALRPVLSRHWTPLAATAAQRRLLLEDRCPADIMLTTDPMLLDVVLSNALSNAVAYTPETGCIRIEAETAADACRLRVTNSVCGLRDADVAKVFDRFWRADAARVRGTGFNCGLGLPLVRRAMELVGGKAEARVDEENRFVLSLTFPASEQVA